MQNRGAMTIRRIRDSDLDQAQAIHRKAFVRQSRSREWLECNFRAWPRILSYVAVINEVCVGYIMWNQRSGFREQVVLELEQVAVQKAFRGQGIGRRLIRESLAEVRAELSRRNATLKHILVTTRADNHAQHLYRSALGAETEAVISALYSADEAIMIARHV